MPDYKNPTTEQVNIFLAAVQRASIRVYYANELEVDPDPAIDQQNLLVKLFREIFGDEHDDRLSAACLGEYDTGRREIPVLPSTGRAVTFKR